jgi:hypothetical protein
VLLNPSDDRSAFFQRMEFDGVSGAQSYIYDGQCQIVSDASWLSDTDKFCVAFPF